MAGVDTDWFQGRLAAKRMSQRGLARLMGLDPAAVSLMLRGKRKMTTTEAAEIARLLNVEVGEVMVRAGAVLPAKEPPAASVARAGKVGPGSAVDGAVTTLEVPIPMANGGLAWVRMPRGITKADAERVCAVVLAMVCV